MQYIKGDMIMEILFLVIVICFSIVFSTICGILIAEKLREMGKFS